MSAPSLLRHRVPLHGDGDGAPAPAAAAEDAVRARPVTSRLAFDMQKQAHDEWCWAAVSASVAAFYGRATRWTQCRIVNAVLARTTCCAEGGSAECNRPAQPERALALVGHLAGDDGTRPTLADVAREIDAGRPLGMCIDWTGGGGHVVAIDGYDLAAQTVEVKDSLFGPSHVPFASFPARYQGGGTWGWTYRTRPG